MTICLLMKARPIKRMCRSNSMAFTRILVRCFIVLTNRFLGPISCTQHVF